MIMRIYLKDVTLDDANFLYKLYVLRDPKDILTPIKKAEQQQFVKKFLKKDPSHPYFDWKLIKFEDKIVGSVTLSKKNNELGFWLLPEFQGKGIGPIAVKKLMEKNNKEYYSAIVRAENESSKSLVNKLGFELTHYKYTKKMYNS